MSRRSVKAAANRAVRAEAELRGSSPSPAESSAAKVFSTDSFQNFQAKLGMNTDNMMSGSTYGFNPVSRNRMLLEWIYRGSWLGGVAVNVVAEDMTRAGVELKGTIDPDDIEKIEEAVTLFNVWSKIASALRWSRLYGGAIAVMLIDGQKPDTPLRLKTVSKGMFKGLLVLDRWMVQPSLEDLVTEMGPDMGKPKYYTVIGDSYAMPRMKIHYSRCVRLEGVELPYYQQLAENLWGMSELERLYDRMVIFDSATTGAGQLVYKSYLRTIKIEGLREVIAGGGPALDGLAQYVGMMARFQSIEGISLLDSKDDLAVHQHQAFSGIGDVLLQIGQQLAGALQIPLVRLFGQSPAGLNATGESDLRTYYDGILQKQQTTLLVPMTRIYRAVAQSEGIVLDEGFRVKFRSLWQMTEKEKSEVTTAKTDSIVKVYEAGIFGRARALEELKQSSEETGTFSNITDKDIKEAEDEPPPGLEGAEENAGGERLDNGGKKIESGHGAGAEAEREPAGAVQ